MNIEEELIDCNECGYTHREGYDCVAVRASILNVSGHKGQQMNIENEHIAITRRDYFAAMAMQGLLANSFSNDRQPCLLAAATRAEIAALARDQADHLINALAVPKRK